MNIEIEPPKSSIKDSVLKVLSRIRETARSRKATELPTATFSNAINAVGEEFVDILLQTERTGKWWLDDAGQWLECSIKSEGERVPRNFARGQSVEWGWFPQFASRLADPMTGPDHVVAVTVPSLKLSANVALEQKLRFGTKQDAFADSTTYVKHLLEGLRYPGPSKKNFEVDAYCSGMLKAAIARLCKTKKSGLLAYSGSVPHVCVVSIWTPPNQIYVTDKEGKTKVACNFVGFLPPSVNKEAFSLESSARSIVDRAKVHLWLGLDELLGQCEAEEVESAWFQTIEGLTNTIHHSEWVIKSKR